MTPLGAPEQAQPARGGTKAAMKARRAAAWNVRREQVLANVLSGAEGVATWELLSRHNTVSAAYIAQNRLRKQHPDTLITHVVNRTDDDVDWSGEVWISNAKP